MRKIIVVVSIALSLAFAFVRAAIAAENVELGPAPGWAKPIELSGDMPPATEAPFQMLLSDQQFLIEKDKRSRYVESAYRIDNSGGLSAGNISFVWRPEAETVTVHKIQIRRGDQIIDVLANGQTFTIARRETNLESAMLDGNLTASILPEGLQVGDIVDFAVTIVNTDTTLGSHSEILGASWNSYSIQRAHMRVTWPTDTKITWREVGGLPALKPVVDGAFTSLELSMSDVQPVFPPKYAPARFNRGRYVEITDFSSWSDLAESMVALYQDAAGAIDAPLQAEIERIRAASSDPKVRTQEVLNLVQDRVRYVALAMGTGGLVPANANTTWSRRYGDCKGKTALMLAMLHALGIEAEPVLVSTELGDGLDDHLPLAGLFDHVIVRANVDGKAYWLDGTRRGDKSLDAIRVPPFHWGLPVTTGAKLLPMQLEDLDAPNFTTAIKMDASGGLTDPAPTNIEMVLRGDAALLWNASLSNLTSMGPDARDRTVRAMWKDMYNFIDVKSTNSSFDEEAGELRLVMEGEAHMDWRGDRYETDGTSIGFNADFSREPGPDDDAPIAVSYPSYSRLVETILLPNDGRRYQVSSGAEVDQTVGAVHIERHTSIRGNVFTVEKTEKSVAPEFPFKDAEKTAGTLKDLYRKTVYLQMQPAPSGQQRAEVNAYIDSGNRKLNASQFDEAIVDYNRALEIDPHNAIALADRGLARVSKNALDDAERDLDASAASNPRTGVLLRARGFLEQKRSNYQKAVEFLTDSLTVDANNTFALYHRAQSYMALGEFDKAITDASTATEISQTWIAPYDLRISAHRLLGNRDRAIEEIHALLSAVPESAQAHMMAALHYAQMGMTAESESELARAEAISPETVETLKSNSALRGVFERGGVTIK